MQHSVAQMSSHGDLKWIYDTCYHLESRKRATPTSLGLSWPKYEKSHLLGVAPWCTCTIRYPESLEGSDEYKDLMWL